MDVAKPVNDAREPAARGRHYHHGDLKAALIATAERQIERDGADAFTLRACAREAGVSHAAPAHHFTDRQGLLAAVAVASFRRLSASMDLLMSDARQQGQPVMAAIGLAYIRYALEHPELYRLMFRLRITARGLPEVVEAADGCHARLLAAVREVAGDPADDGEVQEKAALAWSCVHGFVSLALEGHLEAELGSEVRGPQSLAFAARVLSRAAPVFQGKG